MASTESVETQPHEELMSAVEEADVDKVESILQGQGHNSDVREMVNTAVIIDAWKDTTTALFEACAKVYDLEVHSSEGSDNSVKKYLRIVQLLLDHGADPTIAVEREVSEKLVPFHFAVMSGNLTLIRQLINAKVDVNQTNNKGQSALHLYGRLHSSVNQSEILNTLVACQADVNLQDLDGKTPLHDINRHGQIMALLKVGALATIKDHSGRCPLHIVAKWDNVTMLHMIDLCLKEPKENKEVIIEALEFTALTESCLDPFECMRKATQLRVEHDIKKKILEPMECYGLRKEWETLEELEVYKGDAKGLKLQAVLARERIHQGQHGELMELIKEELISDILEASKGDSGKLLERHLQIFIGLGSGLGQTDFFLNIAMTEWTKEMEEHFESLDTWSILKLIQFTIKSLAGKENHSGYFTVLLAVTTTMAMKLFRRNRQVGDASKNERILAKDVLEELFDKVPTGLDEDFETIPIQHLITKTNFRVPKPDVVSRTPYDSELMKILLESGKIKLNAVDRQGNTLLHIAVDSINADVCNYDTRQILLQGTINKPVSMVKLLLEKGVYPNARNRRNVTARDMLRSEDLFEDACDKSDYDLYAGPIEAAYIEMRGLLQQYEHHYSMTLLTNCAEVIKESGLPYENFLKVRYPGMADILINFINLHGDPNFVEPEDNSCWVDDTESVGSDWSYDSAGIKKISYNQGFRVGVKNRRHGSRDLSMESESETQLNIESESETQSNIDSETQSSIESETPSNIESETQSNIEFETQSNIESETQLNIESEMQSNIDFQAESESGSESNSDFQVESESESKN